MPQPQRILCCRGESLSIEEWSSRSGVDVSTIRSRIDRLGWSAEAAIFTPSDKRFRRGGRKKHGELRPVPPLKRHATGQAYCRWRDGGRSLSRYFGAYGSAESTAAYARFSAEWVSCQGATGSNESRIVHVAEVCIRVIRWAEKYYQKGGKQTSEVHVYRSALRRLNSLYGDTRADDFSPKKLKAVQAAFVGEGLSRETVNAYVVRIRRAFSKAVEMELVPSAIADSLRHVRHEQRGRSQARDPERRKSIPIDVINRTLENLHSNPAKAKVLAAMVQTQLLTGMRPGEVCAMTGGAVDCNDPASWKYEPGLASKQFHRETSPRVIWIGPKAQDVLREFLERAGGSDPVFAFPGRKRGISRIDYGRYIAAACERAGVPPWTPHQLRHTRATAVREHYLSAAAGAAAIGDDVRTALEHYLDPSTEAARRIAIELG